MQDSDVEVETEPDEPEGEFEFRDDVDHEVIGQVADAPGHVDFDKGAEILVEVQRWGHSRGEFDVSVFSGDAFQDARADFVEVREVPGNELLVSIREHDGRAVVAVEQTMLELPDEAYFELLCKMAAALEEKSGVILLNSKDLARVPSDFITRLSALGITATLCDTPNDSIRGGFILKNGDIEDNMTFPAVIADRRDELEDLIGRTLFEA